MSEPQEHRTKKQEEEPYLKSCEKCTKFFTNEQAYEAHIKIKHEQPRLRQASEEDHDEQESQEEEVPQDSRNNKKNKSMPMRSRMLEIQRNQLQDNIYTFLGELGERNVQPINNRAEIINFANDQKLTGQTNYSVNRVIRTPYQEPIKCSAQVPEAQFGASKHHQFLIRLKNQMSVIEGRLDEEKQTWQLRDPMAPEQEIADEFSLMDIKKLVLNYPKRNIKVENPNFSIFLLWLGRICKSPAFKEFYMILGEYLAEYFAIQAHKVKGEPAYDLWRNFHKNFQNKKISADSLEKLKIFDEKNCKKFIEYFVQWSDIFRALSI